MNLSQALADFKVYLESVRGYSPNTVKAYIADISDFKSSLPPESIDSEEPITLNSLRDWLYTLTERGLTMSSIARKSAAIRAFSAWMAKTGQLSVDPGLRLRSPKANKSLPKVVSRASLKQVFDSLEAKAQQNDPIALRDLVTVELLYASGARVSEIAGLNQSDVDYSRNLLRVTGKGSKQRMVPFGQPAAEALERWVRLGRPSLQSDQSRDALLLNHRGGRIGVRQIFALVASLLAETNTGAAGPHAFVNKGMCGQISPKIKSDIDTKIAPLYKLTYKYVLPPYDKSLILYYLYSTLGDLQYNS
jgi:integrase/recombinase XerC